MNQNFEKPHKISIEEVIKSKNPNLLRIMPGFLLQYIKRIIHQDHINDFIDRHGDKQSFAFVDAVIDEFGIKVSYSGLENIPKTGGAIIASNHPLGGLDGMAFIQTIAKVRKDLKFIVNDVLLRLKNLSDIFVGVNKHGKNSAELLAQIDTYYEGDGLVLIFPAGLVSRKQDDGKIRDLIWKKSFVIKAKKFNRPVIPVHISGSNSNFFYNLARFRTRLGIKANIEMFYLMNEMYHQNGKEVHVRFGKAITPEQLNQTGLNEIELTAKLKEHIYKMHELNDNNLEFK